MHPILTYMIGGDIGFAHISQNRKHVIRQGSFLLADIIFDDLRFGVVNRILKQVTKNNPTTVVVLVSHLSALTTFYSTSTIG